MLENFFDKLRAGLYPVLGFNALEYAKVSDMREQFTIIRLHGRLAIVLPKSDKKLQTTHRAGISLRIELISIVFFSNKDSASRSLVLYQMHCLALTLAFTAIQSCQQTK